MTFPRWADLTERELDVFRIGSAFLQGRLTSPQTVIWALDLKPTEKALRSAVLGSLDASDRAQFSEPWSTAWSLIEEAWQEPLLQRNAQYVGAARVLARIERGDHTGTLIREIVELVRPRLAVEPGRDIGNRGRRWKPKKLSELVRPSLTSDELQTLPRLGLNLISEADFLRSLARSLDAAVHTGLEVARRFGWDGKSLYSLGSLDRVENVPSGDGTDRDLTDEFHVGIAPSVKLLHGVVAHLAGIDADAARGLIEDFLRAGTLVHERLWASFARDARFATTAQVASYLDKVSDNGFWNLHEFPEASGLRAARFGEFSAADQADVLARLHKGPPRSFWPSAVDAERLAGARTYWTFRELRRIQNAGHSLPETDAAWLTERASEFGDLAASTRLDEGFPGAIEAFDIPQGQDETYELIAGRERLQRLERALKTDRSGWGTDPADLAANWIGKLQNAVHIIADFESTPTGERDFPEVWDRFGWRHNPEPSPQRDTENEALRVLTLLSSLSDETLSEAIAGLSDWLSDWSKLVASFPAFAEIWLRLWPHAVAKTNEEQPKDETPNLNVIVGFRDDAEPRDLDTYNTSVGKLVGAFLALCPNLGEVGDGEAFPPGEPQTLIRAVLLQAEGRAGLIVRHRLIEHLAYFMRADEVWAQANLIPPLADEAAASLPLWNAVVRRQLSPGVLSILAPFMLRRVIDPRLGRETRRSLAFRIAVECLGAHWEGRPSSIASSDSQRTIRAMSEEVRAFAAEAPQRFLRDVSAQENVPREVLFDQAVAPFLQRDWPQERSLATPGISKALADLPAEAGERFAAAVNAIERFLVPFDCWSMSDYGLYGEDAAHVPALTKINSQEKANAFLLLLDRTVGTSDGAIIPNDLSAALQQIRTVAPLLSETPHFRRLATAARV